MVEGMGSREHEVRPDARRHEEYLELCALAASGSLTEAEEKDLREHAARCSECREALKEFESVVDHVIPELASGLAEEPSPDPAFSQDNAEAAFRKRLSEEKDRERTSAEEDTWLSPLIVRRSRSFRRHFDRYQLWLPLAASLLATEEKLKSRDREQSQSAMHTGTLEAKIAELSNSLAERDRLTSEQQEMLAKDHDIRELMGARDLYITEIHDVVRTGEAQKAFGRVFFTRGESLIFYAYDLNETPGVKEASTFEA